MPTSPVTKPAWARDPHDDPDRLPEKVEAVLERRPPRPASRNKLVLDALGDEAWVEPALLAFRTGLPQAEVEGIVADLERRGRLPRQAPLGQPRLGSGTVPPGALVRGRTPAQWLAYDREARAQAEAPPRRPGSAFAAWREVHRDSR